MVQAKGKVHPQFLFSLLGLQCMLVVWHIYGKLNVTLVNLFLCIENVLLSVEKYVCMSYIVNTQIDSLE